MIKKIYQAVNLKDFNFIDFVDFCRFIEEWSEEGMNFLVFFFLILNMFLLIYPHLLGLIMIILVLKIKIDNLSILIFLFFSKYMCLSFFFKIYSDLSWFLFSLIWIYKPCLHLLNIFFTKESQRIEKSISKKTKNKNLTFK